MSGKVIHVVSMLSLKYGFNLEEAMECVKNVKNVKSVKKVEVSDIFEEMTRESSDEKVVEKEVVVKEKKARTSAQLAAFEKMRVKRAEKLAEKVAEKEKAEQEGVVIEKVVKEKKEKVVKEKKEKVVKEVKEKKPRSEAQLLAFEKMKEAKALKKAQKVEEKVEEKVKEKVEEKVEEKEEVLEVSVRKFQHEGVEYLKSSNNTIYDINTEEVVGMWNGSSIIDIELEEEEEIEE